MTQPPGWYDDPEDPTRVRYWDGVIWTGRTTPRVNPNLERSGIGSPATTQPGASEPRSPWEAPGGAGPWQGQQQPGQQPQWQQHPYGRAAARATTPDGQPLAGWWRRVIARFLDGIIIGIISIPFSYWAIERIQAPMQQWLDDLVNAASTGSTQTPALPPQVVTYVGIISLISFVLYGIYEVFFLSRSGATPGKRVVGISVRLRNRPGPAPGRQLLNRYLVKEGGAVVGLLPLIGFAGSIFLLVNYLWPLWDNRKQALHDKVAETNVVLGGQPPTRTGTTL